MYHSLVVVYFFCKQKTAYEMRISDWSSDVCSSDLKKSAAANRPVGAKVDPLPPGKRPDNRLLFGRTVTLEPLDPARHAMPLFEGFDAGRDPDGARKSVE